MAFGEENLEQIKELLKNPKDLNRLEELLSKTHQKYLYNLIGRLDIEVINRLKSKGAKVAVAHNLPHLASLITRIIGSNSLEKEDQELYKIASEGLLLKAKEIIKEKDYKEEDIKKLEILLSQAFFRRKDILDLFEVFNEQFDSKKFKEISDLAMEFDCPRAAELFNKTYEERACILEEKTNAYIAFEQFVIKARTRALYLKLLELDENITKLPDNLKVLYYPESLEILNSYANNLFPEAKVDIFLPVGPEDERIIDLAIPGLKEIEQGNQSLHESFVADGRASEPATPARQTNRVLSTPYFTPAKSPNELARLNLKEIEESPAKTFLELVLRNAHKEKKRQDLLNQSRLDESTESFKEDQSDLEGSIGNDSVSLNNSISIRTAKALEIFYTDKDTGEEIRVALDGNEILPIDPETTFTFTYSTEVETPNRGY